MTVPTAKVEVAFGSTWQTDPDSRHWTNVTSEVMDRRQPVSTMRGATSIGGQADTGQLDLTLRNANRRFDPTAVSIPITTLRLPGTAGNYASCPDTAALDIVGDLDLRAHISPDDWSPVAIGNIVAKWSSTGNQRSYEFRLLTGGELSLRWSEDGTAVITATSTANLSALANGARKWVRAVLDVSFGFGSRVTFYSSDDGLNWAPLGDPVDQALTSVFASTAALEVGAATAGSISLFDGDIHYVEVRSGIAGTPVAAPQFGLQPAGTPSFSDGYQTWTLAGTAAVVASTGAGPFYGRLLPGVPIRVNGFVAGYTDTLTWVVDTLTWDVDSLTWGGGGDVAGPVSAGTVAKWPQRYDRGNRQATVPITGYDGFDKLARAKIPRSALESEILSSGIIRGFWPLSETSGVTMQDVTANGRDGTYTVGTTATTGEIKTPPGATHPALVLDGDDYATVPVAIQTTSHAVAALVDISGVDGLTNGDTLVLAEYGIGDNRAAGKAFQWGIEIVSTAAKTARLYVKGTTVWANYGYSGSFGYNQPRYVASRFAVTGSIMAHYVDGAVSSSTSNPSAITGDVVNFRALGTKANGGNFKGAVAALLWSDAATVSASRVAAYSAAALAPLDRQTSDQRITWVLDELGWPADLRVLATGRTLLGPATFKPGDNALEYLRLVNASEDGRLFITASGYLRFTDRYFPYLDPHPTVSQFTFSDATTKGYAEFDLDLDDELLVNVARFTRRDGTEQVVTNATSVATYGEAELQQSNLLQGTDAEVRSLAEWTVTTRSTPLPRVPKIRIPVHKYSAADQATVLGLNLGWRVTCVRTPQAIGTAITLDFLVDGIKHDITATEWWVELYVSPVPQSTVSLFLLGSSLLGGTHILAM